ncbi:MAG: glycosyltransferase family 4 protein [Collinsella sp.]
MLNHIAIFSAYYPPHLGGVEQFTHNLATELTTQNIKVTVVTSSIKGLFRISDGEVTVIGIPSKSIMGDRFPLMIPSKATFKQIKELTEAPFDGIVINTRYYPICLLGCRIARVHNLRPVLIDHSSGPISNEKTPLGFAMRTYETINNRLIKSKRPIGCSVSERGLSWLKSIGFDARAVIPNSIDCTEYRASAKSNSYKELLSLTNSDFLVTYAGRLLPEKGLPKLLEAVSSLNAAGVCVHLAVAGSGPLEGKLLEAHETWLHYMGRLSKQELSGLLRDSDCFCLPTEYPEGLPTVLLEAAAQHCAIVVSNCAGAREVVPSKEYGTVLNVVSEDEIAKAILVYCNDRGATTTCGDNVALHIEHGFSWAATANKLIKILDAS